VKVLRILRRRKIRLSFICMLLLVFIFNTYAWISFDTDPDIGGLTANVSSWAVEFLITEENLKTEEYTYEIDEFYPGVTDAEPIVKRIEVYNVGEAYSFLEYRIKEIYLYGEQILQKEDAQGIKVAETLGDEVENADGTYTVNAFGDDEATIFNAANSNYVLFEGEDDSVTLSLRYPTPFTISYTYDKKKIEGSNGETSSKAWMTLNLAWYNDENNNEEDTKLGNLAYEYKLRYPDEPALKLVVEVKAIRDLDSVEHNTYA